MARKCFGVDSGLYIVIDPCYLDRFMRFFNYEEMVGTSNFQAYVDRVMEKAYPRAPKGSVALVETSEGDGSYSFDVRNIVHKRSRGDG